MLDNDNMKAGENIILKQIPTDKKFQNSASQVSV
jgi:hypothetical protein